MPSRSRNKKTLHTFKNQHHLTIPVIEHVSDLDLDAKYWEVSRPLASGTKLQLSRISAIMTRLKVYFDVDFEDLVESGQATYIRALTHHFTPVQALYILIHECGMDPIRELSWKDPFTYEALRTREFFQRNPHARRH